MSVDLVSLPEILSAPARLLRDDDDAVRDNVPPPCTDNRSLLLRDVEVEVESRLRDMAAGDIPLTSVALIPSSPTVACRISSRNVHKPSLKSEAICFPVCTSEARDAGGIFVRHSVIISSVGTKAPFTLRSVDEGSVADRGILPTNSFSIDFPDSDILPLLNPESVDAESNDNVLACEP